MDQILEEKAHAFVNVFIEKTKNMYDYKTLYKLCPIVFMVYMTYPIIQLAWDWLPWIYSSYGLYKLLPSGTIPTILKLLENK
jgi:hypothetical protein